MLISVFRAAQSYTRPFWLELEGISHRPPLSGGTLSVLALASSVSYPAH
jgi:hypothetical protein